MDFKIITFRFRKFSQRMQESLPTFSSPKITAPSDSDVMTIFDIQLKFTPYFLLLGETRCL